MIRKNLTWLVLALAAAIALAGCVPPGTPGPTVETAPTASLPPTPVTTGFQHYEGPNPYRATPTFDVAYEPASWEYVADDGSGRPSQLKHRSIADCAIWLRAGPVDTEDVGTADLASRSWTIGRVQPNIVQYSTPEADINWILGVFLPAPFSAQQPGACQQAAEQVIDTFRANP